MKKLIFVRHGKAEDESPEISDFERSLTLKGKVISRLMAQKLAGERKIIRELFLQVLLSGLLKQH